LHGFRLAEIQLGERIAVIGLGLLGLLSVGIARAAGCTVFGVDLDPQRVALAEQMGAIAVQRLQAEEGGRSLTQGRGFDAVLICADTPASDPVELAGVLARERAKVIAVGAVGLSLPRKVYYEKELQLIVSRSYGPGRYDPQYEENGIDYPFGYVRWTEGRNLQAVVELLASGKLDVKPLITHRFSIEQGEAAYDLISGKSRQPFLGVLLTYPQSEGAIAPLRRVELITPAAPLEGLPGLGVLGAGNYATAVFLPVVQRAGGVQKVGIASASGLSARHAAQRYGFGFASSQESDILANPQIQVVAILTRHQHHARQVIQALRAGQHVFCEKPLAITPEELKAIQQLLEEKPPALLTVGFNRRFAPFSRQLAQFLENRREPMFIHYRVNAGYLPLTHWLHDSQQGGGRIIGEGCHFIDYLTFLVGKPPLRVRTVGLPDGERYRQDNVCMTFTFEDGSIGTVTYLANGDKSLPKERVEVFCAGRVAVLEDYRSLEFLQNGQRQKFTARLRQDKGHRALWEAFVQAVRQGGQPPIPYDHLISVTRSSFAAVESLRQQADVEINQA
jgi:predicted dehydrogenase